MRSPRQVGLAVPRRRRADDETAHDAGRAQDLKYRRFEHQWNLAWDDGRIRKALVIGLSREGFVASREFCPMPDSINTRWRSANLRLSWRDHSLELAAEIVNTLHDPPHGLAAIHIEPLGFNQMKAAADLA